MKANVTFKYKGFTAKLYFSPEYGNDFPYGGSINFPPLNNGSLQVVRFKGMTMSETVRDFEERIDKWLKDNNIQPSEEGDYGEY